MDNLTEPQDAPPDTPRRRAHRIDIKRLKNRGSDIRRLAQRLRPGGPILQVRPRYDLPLSTDVTGRFMPWIVALMVFLACLALGVAVVLSDLAQRLDTDLSGQITVQVDVLDASGAMLAPPALEQRLAAVEAVLAQDGTVTGLRRLPPSETEALMNPWLGSLASSPDLPLPRLIEGSAAERDPARMKALGAKLDAVAPGTELDDHAAWLSDLIGLAGALKVIAIVVVVLIAAAMTVAVVFSSRAGLAIHAQVVELLHIMGAPDDYIARQFQNHVVALAIKGSLIGLVAGAATLLAIDRAGAGLESVLLPDLSMGLVGWLLIAILPLAAALLGGVTARLTVSRALRQMP